jgi:2-methylcitrate dehydratase
MEDDMKSKDDNARPGVPGLGRRELMKLGAGAVAAAALSGPRALAQRGGGSPARPAPPPGSFPDGWRPHTGPGYQTNFHRLGENGPMDDTTREIVHYVANFKESDVTPSARKAFNRTMVDSMAAGFAGFEEDASRIAARTARYYPGGTMKSTVWGYGITSTPEHASFVNSAMVRMVDFNATPHTSNLIPAALAVGEALHSTGSQVMAAIVLAYEVEGAPGTGESVGPAMAAGKLMGLDEDRLANALTLALTPHVALNKGVGALSMWKGTRSAEAIKCGVWAAMLAREGMTGPPQPFEGVGGEWYREGQMGRPFKLPAQAKLAIEGGVNKRFPSDQLTQQALAQVAQIRAWTKPDEIEWIEYYGAGWGEVGTAPKWDPRNRDTADHSIPYVLARSIISGESYLDTFNLSKFPVGDPAVKELIDKITFSPVPEWQGNGTCRIVVHKKNGEEKYWDAFNGSRDPGEMGDYPQMSDEDINAKFKRVCAYRHISDAQRDQFLNYFWNISAVKDIGEPMRALANFGKPLAL